MLPYTGGDSLPATSSLQVWPLSQQPAAPRLAWTCQQWQPASGQHALLKRCIIGLKCSFQMLRTSAAGAHLPQTDIIAMNFFLKAIVVLAAALLAAVPTQAAGENHFTPCPFQHTAKLA